MLRQNLNVINQSLNWLSFWQFTAGFDTRPGQTGNPCKTSLTESSYSQAHPMAVYYPGQQVVLAHPMKVNNRNTWCRNCNKPSLKRWERMWIEICFEFQLCSSSVASSKILGRPKCLILGESVFCLGYRHSKHKMTICSKNFREP